MTVTLPYNFLDFTKSEKECSADTWLIYKLIAVTDLSASPYKKTVINWKNREQSSRISCLILKQEARSLIFR